MGTSHRNVIAVGAKIQEMPLLWEQGTGDVVAVGTTNKAQEMLLLWEQDTWYVIAVGTRHMR